MSRVSAGEVRVVTDRLVLREIVLSDIHDLKKILQDPETMQFHGGKLNIIDTYAWLMRQRKRYKKNGTGLWAVVLKETGEMIGQCGITHQHYKDEIVPQLGYLFNKAYWHKGYATESALACKKYAFEALHLAEIYSIINVANVSSQRVAERNGMVLLDTFKKKWLGKEIDMHLYVATHDGAFCDKL